MSFAATWMDIEILILSEVSHTSTLLRVKWGIITINDYARITSINQN